MLLTILSIVSFGVLVAEFWMGIAVGGWSGETIERAASPGPYWFTMALHTVIGVGLLVLAVMAM